MCMSKSKYIYRKYRLVNSRIAVNKKEAVLVLPVFANNPSFLSIINKNCKVLYSKCPLINWTIVIVNDGSPLVISQQQLKEELTANIRFLYYHYPENKGKGYAIRFGLLKAGDADIFMYTDYDFPFGPMALVRAASLMATGDYDVVSGDRGDDYLALLPVFRKILTRSTRKLNRHLLGMRCTDTQAGLKVFNNRSLPSMLYTGIDGFLFDMAFIRAVERQNLRLARMPVHCPPAQKMKNFGLKTLLRELGNLYAILRDKTPGDVSIIHSEELVSVYRRQPWLRPVKSAAGNSRLGS